MMRLLSSLAFATLMFPSALCAPNETEQDPFLAMVAKDPGGHFVKADAIDLDRVIPPCPKKGSLSDLADLETMLQVQVWRSPEQEAWAKHIERDSIFNNASVLGPWFTASNLPTCQICFRKVAADIYVVCEVAKKRYSRPRPSIVDPRVKPCVKVPTNTSYPSGHSAQAFIAALMLDELFPEHREALLARAHKAAWSRIIGGVHYPTDDVAGRLLAEAAFKVMMKNPAFREALEQCRKELAPFRLKKAG